MKDNRLKIILAVVFIAILIIFINKKSTKEDIENNPKEEVQVNKEETKNNEEKNIEKNEDEKTNKESDKKPNKTDKDVGLESNLKTEYAKEIVEKNKTISTSDIHIYIKKEKYESEEIQTYLKITTEKNNEPVVMMYKKEQGMDEIYTGVLLNKENAYIRNLNAEISFGSIANLSAEAKEAQRIVEKINEENKKTKEMIDIFLYKMGYNEENPRKDDKNFEYKYIFQEVELKEEKQKMLIFIEQKIPNEEYSKKIEEQTNSNNKKAILNLLEEEVMIRFMFTEDNRLIKTETLRKNKKSIEVNTSLINAKLENIIEENETTIINFIPKWEKENYIEKDFLEAIN